MKKILKGQGWPEGHWKRTSYRYFAGEEREGGGVPGTEKACC